MYDKSLVVDILNQIIEAIEWINDEVVNFSLENVA
jgi:hypothetical protein